MSGIAILQPIGIAAIEISSGTGAPNMLTAPPREVCVTGSAAGHVIDIDMGRAVTIDTLYIGNCTVPDGAQLLVHVAPSWQVSGAVISSGAFKMARSRGPGHAAFVALTAPVTSRYFRIAINLPAAASIQIGVVALGRRWEHPYAFGSGRQPIDTSRVTDLADGGFGIDPGAMKTSFKWRFIDLQDGELEDLYDLAWNLGVSRVVVIAEDIDAAPRTASSVHYGLFGKFEAYERTAPRDSSWALSMTEWV
jgi:hypothetical protein